MLRLAALVFVKSPSHFRVSFKPDAERVLVADTPGASCANIRRLKFQHVRRPLAVGRRRGVTMEVAMEETILRSADEVRAQYPEPNPMSVAKKLSLP